MQSKIRWGILSTAKIAREKVIPALQNGDYCEVTAICSRSIEQAEATAKALNIPKAYGSYEELLKDPELDAIYNPLPNNMHLEWSIKAIKAGKHVLCEKPIGLNAKEAIELSKVAKQYPSLKISEAFMYRFHPQWLKVKSLIDEGSIGEVKAIQSFFSYYNVDPQNIRNRVEVGGGALMDIGCYCISFPRFIFGTEPKRLVSMMDRDPVLKTDILSSAMLDFADGRNSSFTCSTQLMPYQRVQIVGDQGHIEIEIPVNAPKDTSSKVWLRTKNGSEVFTIEPVDQYTLQGDAFAKAIINNTEIQPSLDDAIANMKVIDAVVESAKTNSWILL